MTEWVAVAGLVLAVAMAIPPRARLPTSSTTSRVIDSDEDSGWMRRGRWLWSTLAGAGAAAFVSGTGGLVVGIVAAAATWWWVGRAEPPSVRRSRATAERELPGVVHLLTTALESGCDVAEALRVVADALPGQTTQQLGAVPARLALGVPPDAAWRPVLDSPELAPLGRAMVRAHRSGAAVTDEVGRLADELDRRSRARVEDRARAVGVKAAVPLGVCLLPSFLLIGVVPLVAALLQSLSW